MLIAEFQVGEVLWSMAWFTLFFLWIWLVIRVFADIFRSQDLGGVGKALWTVFVILLPYLGVFVYLIARGSSMAARDFEQARARDEAMRAYIREAAGTA
jgi:predicted permease